jgi:SWI/SNF-related matrix-associated actin-dependent regulator of chromatin subfamily A3
VFTSWRSTLDILANMLTDRGIPCLRIDGRVSFSDRLEILSKFREDPNTPVLLMSIETGAVGYGSRPMLTTASLTNWESGSP